MTTQAPALTGLLDDLIICQNCGASMTAREDHQGVTSYQCVNDTSDAPKRCRSPRIDTCRIDHDVLSQVALTLNAPVPQKANALPKFCITDATIANLVAHAADPQHHKTAILALARHPETYTRADVIQQTRALLADVVDRITFSGDDIVIHYAIPLPDCKLRLGRYYGFATPQSEIF